MLIVSFGPDSYYHIRITDANNEKTYIALDAFGRRIEILYPSNNYQQLEYNGDGTLKGRAVWEGDDPPGTIPLWIEYFYDGYGRLADVNYPDEGNVHYSYDGFGRKILVEDGRNIDDRIGGTSPYANKISYDYDPLNRIIGITEQDGYEITYTYKADGQKENIAVYKPGQQNPVYWVQYGYDTALRLANVNEPLLTNDLIASFEYDENGNRKKLTYSLDGTTSSTVYIDYNYNRDNLLTYFSTTGGPTFTLNNATVDGLGRLTDANETISKTSGTVDYSYTYVYDMRSQLTEADITKDSSPWWDADYSYYKNGNLKDREIQSSKTEFEYTGEVMDGTKTGGGEYFELAWDENGNMIDFDISVGDDTTLEYNWDGKLRSGEKGSDTISLRYDPDGNRIFKASSESGQRKYIVDIVGGLPVILMELDSADNMDIMKKYTYAHGQILAQHDIDDDAITPKDDIYFYLHNRLGSVRQIIDTSGNVKNRYTYDPFGEGFATECTETIENPFKFTGQFYDSEIDEYYLRARQYDPHIARFTARDPVLGDFEEPLTLHVYLYCLNNPVRFIDPSGCFGMTARTLTAIYMRCAAFSMVLGSDIALSDMALGLAAVTEEANKFLDPKDEVNKIDYRTGPRAFRHLKITAKDIEKYGTIESAEIMVQFRIAMRGSLEAGKYYAVGGGSVVAGIATQLIGYKLIKSSHVVPGVVLCAGGFALEGAGVYSAAQAIKITNNAREAAELYGKWRGPQY